MKLTSLATGCWDSPPHDPRDEQCRHQGGRHRNEDPAPYPRGRGGRARHGAVARSVALGEHHSVAGSSGVRRASEGWEVAELVASTAAAGMGAHFGERPPSGGLGGVIGVGCRGVVVSLTTSWRHPFGDGLFAASFVGHPTPTRTTSPARPGPSAHYAGLGAGVMVATCTGGAHGRSSTPRSRATSGPSRDLPGLRRHGVGS
ncbi:hypothetical protein QJS66_08435 [Kocuria rhizophila]|nr:hypothetical protein QJS66_08435 [Kocuria rhizophila]